MNRWHGFALAGALALAALFIMGRDRAGGFTSSPPTSAPKTPDAVTAFLDGHWPEAIAAQGDPPPGYSALEASLDPRACGQCHVQQFADWRSSLHSRAMGPGIRWQFESMSQAAANRCMRCHAPLAEQKALLAVELGWTHAPAKPPPAYVPHDLHRQGLVCAACHVRRHQRAGPPRRADLAPSQGAAPHGGFTAEPAFEDSRFCAVCHQFAPDGARLAGKLIENTYEEWRASPAAREGKSCQSCHMPDRRHLWRGIHDVDMVRKALNVRLSIRTGADGRLDAMAELVNVGAGHHFPTYLIPEVMATLDLIGPDGRSIARLGQHVIGRKADLTLTREIADTRIPAGGRSTFSASFDPPPEDGFSVELRVVVHPGKHYELLFRSVLDRREPPTGRVAALLQQALVQLRAGAYELHRERLPVMR